MGDIITPKFPVNTEDIQETISIDKGLLTIDSKNTLPFALSFKVSEDMYLSIVGREEHCYISEVSINDESVATKKCKTLFEAFVFAIQSYSKRGPT